MRRLRWLVNGRLGKRLAKALCLLSLLACLATAWLWWHGRRVQRDEVALPVAGLSLDLESDREELRPALVRGWPVRLPLFHSYASEDDPAAVGYVVVRSLWEREGKWLCLRCGYDLRGNTSGTCSECGTAVEVVRRVTA